MKKFIIALTILLLPILVTAETDTTKTAWDQMAFLEGVWTGTGGGYTGTSEVTQTYDFQLKDKYLKMTTKAVFAPTEKKPEGEIHEDFALFSYDKARGKVILRAFYVEGFVITYALNIISDDMNELTFESEDVENAPDGTKAKLIFKKISDNEYEQGFHVAFPGQEFGCFNTNNLKKVVE